MPLTRTSSIELTASEKELFAGIHFGSRDHDAVRASIASMAMLTTSLLERGGVPEVRLLYFTDPERNPGGRGKSRQEVFEKNGTIGDEILSHPNFLKYLEYFVFGPDLPVEIIQAFKSAASYNGYLDGEDLSDLASAAKALVRERRLEPHAAAEEFFKLALECGAMPWSADSLRRSVKAVRLG